MKDGSIQICNQLNKGEDKYSIYPLTSVAADLGRAVYHMKWNIFTDKKKMPFNYPIPLRFLNWFWNLCTILPVIFMTCDQVHSIDLGFEIRMTYLRKIYDSKYIDLCNSLALLSSPSNLIYGLLFCHKSYILTIDGNVENVSLRR